MLPSRDHSKVNGSAAVYLVPKNAYSILSLFPMGPQTISVLLLSSKKLVWLFSRAFLYLAIHILMGLTDDTFLLPSRD